MHMENYMEKTKQLSRTINLLVPFKLYTFNTETLEILQFKMTQYKTSYSTIVEMEEWSIWKSSGQWFSAPPVHTLH